MFRQDRFFDTFDGAKPQFLNRGKKRRSVSTLSIPRASDRGVEWVDFSPALAGRNSGHLNLSKTTSCLDEIGILNLDIILLIDAEKD
jgi:hypothetical protein